MKKWFLQLVTIFSIMLIAHPSFSDDKRHGFYIDTQVSAAIPKDDDLDIAAYYGGRLGYQLNDHIAVEAESGYVNFDDDLGIGSVSMIPLLLNLKLHPLAAGAWDPYFLAGLGVVFTDVDINQDGVHDFVLAETGIDISTLGLSFSGDIDDALAGQVGMGMLYHITEDAACFIEIRVLLAEADATATVTSPEITVSGTEEEELHTLLIGGGMRIKF